MNETLSFADNLFLLAVYLTGGGAVLVIAAAIAELLEWLDKRRSERAEAHTRHTQAKRAAEYDIKYRYKTAPKQEEPATKPEPIRAVLGYWGFSCDAQALLQK